MSFSVGAQARQEDIINQLQDSFSGIYSDPAPGVKEIFEAGCDYVENFLDSYGDEGVYSVSISGHAKQDDENKSDRNYLSLSVSPIN